MRVVVLIFMLFFGNILQAQILGSRLEKEEMEVGGVNAYHIFVTGTNGKKISIPKAKTFMPFHFEIISDSLVEENGTAERIIQFTILEEGEFRLPQVEVITGGRVQKTLDYGIKVVNPASGDEKFEDNVMPREVDLQWGDYWEMYKFYVLGALAGLAILFVVIFLAKYYRKQKSSPVRESNAALKLLKSIKKKKYIENGDHRAFYVETVDLARQYMHKRFGLPAEVLLTDDLVEFLKSKQVFSTEITGRLGAFLLRGDAVKFARTSVSKEDMEKDYGTVEDLIRLGGVADENENYRKEI